MHKGNHKYRMMNNPQATLSEEEETVDSEHQLSLSPPIDLVVVVVVVVLMRPLNLLTSFLN